MGSVHFGRLALFAFLAWLSMHGLAASQSANQPAAETFESDGSAGWEYVPERYIPGPGWLADDPTALYAPAPPDPDGWDVSYPYKYYPQGNASIAEGVYEPSFLPAIVADECFCTPPPCYFGSFYFDTVVLGRSDNIESHNVIFGPTLAPLVNTTNLSLDTEAGIRLGVLLPGPSGNDWMFDYFGINAFQDSITVTDPIGLISAFYDVNAVANFMRLEYESKLDSIEFSIRSRQTRRLAPIAGIRYVGVHEMLNNMETTVGQRVGQYSTADNDLFGFQFGCQGLLFEVGRWRLETIVKAGPYLNDVDVDVRGGTLAGSEITRHVDHWHTAFVGDVRLGLVCRLGPRVNFRIGYQGLWVEGVALSPNQLDNISFATGRESVDLSGVIYQGGYIGFDLSW
jgi:hypothetical protein